MLTLVAEIVAEPGAAKQLKPLLDRLVGQTRKEYGCISYELYQESETHFLMFEEWFDQAALDKHMASVHFAEFNAAATQSNLLQQVKIRYLSRLN
ncbi:MAG TPA: putative quinol monooxygenase [Rheinheimera sp.]|uniref:putative quinol monooxygenase n=1 Tax=Rheinheimera sp. TaxID=1869214 RepID=UPI002F93B282